jgi:uncharacterized RDD family membrane protein YckC
VTTSDAVAPTRSTTDVVGPRIGAQLIDVVVVFALQTLAILVGAASFVQGGDGTALGTVLLLSFVLFPLYGTLLEGFWNGQTLGKRALNVKVVDRSGHEPTARQAFVRNVPGFVKVSWLPALVALATMASNDLRQRIFDTYARTYVVDATTSATGATHPSKSPGYGG